MTGTKSFGQYLPYWATRTVATSLGDVGCLILKDGAMAVGLRVEGADVHTATAGVINRTSAGLRAYLNQLPAKAYLQVIFESGFDFEHLLAGYASQDVRSKLPLLSVLRQRRLALLRSDTSLTRTRLTYYVGLRDACGQLLSHRASKKGLFGARRHPSKVRAEAVRAAAEELSYHAKQLHEHLGTVGMRAEALTEQELLQEFHRAVNPSSSKLAPPPVMIESREDLKRLTNGERAVLRGPSLSTQLPLGALETQPEHLRVDGIYLRMLGMQRYPFATDPTTLHALQYKFLPATPMRLVITHMATQQQVSKEELERRRNTVQAQLGRMTLDHEAQKAYQQHEALLAELATSDSRIFDTSINAVVTGLDLQELETATRETQKGFAATQAPCATRAHKQFHTWIATLPGNGHKAPDSYPVLTANSAHLTPYWQPSEGIGEPDFLFGTRQRSLYKLSWRPQGGRDDVNTFVLGAMGSGKTFLASHIIKTTLALGGHVVVADTKGPQNSTYRPLAELLDGHYIALNAVDDIAFNPCPGLEELGGWEPNKGGVLPDQLEFLRDTLLLVAVPDIDTTREKDIYRDIATSAILELYRGRKETPLLEDAARAFLALKHDNTAFTDKAKDMAMRIGLWCRDPRRGLLLNRRSRFRGDNPFSIYDFEGLGKDPELSAVLVATLAARIFEKMNRLPRHTPKLFIFDEAWAFFNYSALATRLVETLARVVRSYGAGCMFASQSHKDVVASGAARALMATTSYRVLLRHNAEHEQVAETFNLSERELTLFRALEFRSGHYAEMLWVDAHTSSSALLRYKPSAYEMWIDTSRPTESELRAHLTKRMGSSLAAIEYLADTYPHGVELKDVERELKKGAM